MAADLLRVLQRRGLDEESQQRWREAVQVALTGLASSFVVLPSQLLENCVSCICSQACVSNSHFSSGDRVSGALAPWTQNGGETPQTGVYGDPASEETGRESAAVGRGAVGAGGAVPRVPGAAEAATLTDADVETLAELAGVLLQPSGECTGRKRKRTSAAGSKQPESPWSFPPHLVGPYIDLPAPPSPAVYPCQLPNSAARPLSDPQNRRRDARSRYAVMPYS